MEREQRDDRFTAIEDKYAGYTVYDMNYEKIGKVDDLFVDENDQPEYIGVKMGFLGLRSTLIPWEMARVNEQRQLIEVSASKDQVKDAPTFDDDEEITPDFEEQVYRHFGLQREQGAQRGAYGAYYGNEEHPVSEEGAAESEDDLKDTDELRVQRSEEELRAGTREREAGAVNVRKRVRTEREQQRVPTRREEVSVERVPVDEEASSPESQIGDDEVSVPVVEEEVVAEKRPVVKEEVRLRKDVVEDEEVVEEDVRKEEVDVDDRSRRRDDNTRNG